MEEWSIGDGPQDQAQGELVNTEVPPRQDVGAGTDHPLEEDESPEIGALGGKLVDFADGVAYYDDGTATDGTEWRKLSPEDDTLIASAYARMVARLDGGPGKG